MNAAKGVNTTSTILTKLPHGRLSCPMRGFSTDKFRAVGVERDLDPPDLGCTVRQLQLSFRDGSLFKESPKLEEVLSGFTSAVNEAANRASEAWKMAKRPYKLAKEELKHALTQEPDEKGDGGAAADQPDQDVYDAWCEVVVSCKETIKDTKSTYDVVKKESDGKLEERRLVHGPINMEWAFIATSTGQLCQMFHVLA